MFKSATKKGWADLGIKTMGSANSPMSIIPSTPPEAKTSIASKLMEKLGKAREQLATASKKSNPESLATEHEHDQLDRGLQKEVKSEPESDDELNYNSNPQREDGFTEKYDEQNELQRKARQTMVMLKKSIKKREPATRNNQMNSQTIPILSYQYQQGPGMSLPAPNLRQMATFESGQSAKKAVNEEKYNMKIDDPNSVLHIANYHQNKDFENFAKVINEDNKQYLKINAPDAFTFFRLHHELHEMNRKKARFLDMKSKFFDNKDPEEVKQYDENLDNFDAINSDKNYSSSGRKKDSTDKKEDQYAEKIASKLKDSKRKKDQKALEMNAAYGFMNGKKGN